jgi:CelD/BcsL family acetyltransferase involved in cellulose biosynthesis
MTAAAQERNGSTPAGRDEVVPLDRAGWESAARQFGDHSYRQSWAYGVKLAARRGATSEHVAIRSGDDTVALADVRIKRLPLIGGGLAYISGGPLVRRLDGSGDPLDCLDRALEALVREYVRGRGLTLRIVAPIGVAEENEAVAERFRSAGFHPTERGEPYRTVLLNVDRPLEEIRSSFHRHWRRHLSGSERNELEVTFGTEPDRFEQVASMSEAMRARKGFEVDLDAGFYADVQRDCDEQDQLVVGLVLKDGTPVAGNITAVHGDTAVYLVGASSEAGLECKAGYAMHWRTIELLRERGLLWYDLGGIDPVANPGVTSFKLRTNGFDVTAAGPFEMSPAGLRGRVAGWAERAYLRARRSGVSAR